MSPVQQSRQSRRGTQSRQTIVNHHKQNFWCCSMLRLHMLAHQATDKKCSTKRPSDTISHSVALIRIGWAPQISTADRLVARPLVGACVETSPWLTKCLFVSGARVYSCGTAFQDHMGEEAHLGLPSTAQVLETVAQSIAHSSLQPLPQTNTSAHARMCMRTTALPPPPV